MPRRTQNDSHVEVFQRFAERLDTGKGGIGHRGRKVGVDQMGSKNGRVIKTGGS